VGSALVCDDGYYINLRFFSELSHYLKFQEANCTTTDQPANLTAAMADVYFGHELQHEPAAYERAADQRGRRVLSIHQNLSITHCPMAVGFFFFILTTDGHR
jgi:hypothetical protein